MILRLDLKCDLASRFQQEQCLDMGIARLQVWQDYTRTQKGIEYTRTQFSWGATNAVVSRCKIEWIDMLHRRKE